VDGDTLDLLEDEEIRIVKLTALQCSVIRQMVFPWVFYYERLVNEFPSYWEIVDQPQDYKDALEALELMVGGGYVPPAEEIMGDVYENRGNVSANDFAIGSGLIADNTWRVLSLADIVTDLDATVVYLRFYIKDGAVGAVCQFKKYEATGTYTTVPLTTQVVNVYNYASVLVPIAPTRWLEYKISSGMDETGITILGWWKPTYGYSA
jgi:hypothetical protein